MSVSALRVSNEAFLISSTIERCPKTMMLRELVMNAIEGAQGATGDRLVEIKPVLIDGVAKLCIWNTAQGLTPDELERMSDLASSIRKENSLDQNFGMGAKVAALPSNKFGLRYRSCRDGRVFETILAQRDGVYGRLVPEGSDRGVSDVTASCRDAGVDLSQDWVEVVLLGNSAEQDTVRNPYAGNPAMAHDWVMAGLLRRFFRMPPGVTLRVAADILGTAAAAVFQPEGDRPPSTAWVEVVTVSPDVRVHYRYLPLGTAEDSVLLGSGSIVHRHEVYGLVDGQTWLREAVACGLSFGAKFCTVLVELSPRYEVRPEAYRQFLRFNDGDQRQVYLRDFSSTIRSFMPEWLRKVVASYAPPEVDFLGELRHDLRDLIIELDIAPTRRDNLFSRGMPDAAQQDQFKAPRPDLPPSGKVFERPPEIINLRDQAAIDERELNGRAASYASATHQLFVNMTYPAIIAMQTRLQQEREWQSDPAFVARGAQEVAEWAITQRIARALIYSLGKSTLGWSQEEVARAQSSEALSLVADDYAALLTPARRQLFEILGEVPARDEVASSTASHTREAVEGITKLMQARQAARAKLDQGAAAIPFLRRVSEIELAQGNVRNAEDWINQAIAIQPNDPWLHKHRATVLQSHGAHAAASEALQTALGLNPPERWPFEEHLAHLALRESNPAEALRWAKSAQASNPSNPWTVHLLSVAHERNGDAGDARQCLLSALQHGITKPDIIMRRLSELAARSGDMAEAIRWADEAAADNPREPSSYIHLSHLRERQGDLDGAAAAVEKALLVSPAKPAPILRRASEVALRRGDIHSALSRAEEALDHERTPDSFVTLCSVYKSIGDLDGAERIIQQGNEAVPVPSADLYRQAADIAMRLGRLEAAKERIAKAISINDRDPWTFHAQTYILERAGDLEGAGQASAAAVAIAHDPMPFLARSSDLAIQRNDFKQAHDQALAMVDANPADPRGYIQLSRVLERSGDVEAASWQVTKAMKVGEPIPSFVYRRASEIARARGDGTSKMHFARQAAEAAPLDPWAFHYLSVVLQDEGDLAGAMEAAQRAVQIGAPDPIPFQRRIESLERQSTLRPTA